VFKWLKRTLCRRLAGKGSPPTPREIAVDADTFSEGFRKLGVQHFGYREFLYLGAGHNDTRSRGYGLNGTPPKRLWPHIYELAILADEIRDRLNAPIKLLSIYRSERYNAAILGASLSQHKEGKAMDFTSPQKPASELHRVALGARKDGLFQGGIGYYPKSNFVHVDIRGRNADW
tara:strand:+ start:1223 stop:1747 length:525 start_codon:yes stop_codon:yes gene_type:complete